MPKRRKADTLIQTVERALGPGRFVSYGASWEFVQGLDEVKGNLDALVEMGEAERAVRLYELFLAGCYEKAEEIDDSGGTLGEFFADLFVFWIRARQKAGCLPEETVKQILRWLENDDYGFCFDIEEEVAKALDREGRRLFRQHFEDRFEEAFAPFTAEEPRHIHDYSAAVHMAARVLKRSLSGRARLSIPASRCRPSRFMSTSASTRARSSRPHIDATATAATNAYVLLGKDWLKTLTRISQMDRS